MVIKPQPCTRFFLLVAGNTTIKRWLIKEHSLVEEIEIITNNVIQGIQNMKIQVCLRYSRNTVEGAVNCLRFGLWKGVGMKSEAAKVLWRK